MWHGKRKAEIDVSEHPMSIRIRKPVGEGGPAELEIIGCARACDMEIVRKAISHFEMLTSMKCYVNLGETKHLCPDAIEEILKLRSRIEARGDMFDVVDISAEAESAIREMGFKNVLRPLCPMQNQVTTE